MILAAAAAAALITASSVSPCGAVRPPRSAVPSGQLVSSAQPTVKCSAPPAAHRRFLSAGSRSFQATPRYAADPTSTGARVVRIGPRDRQSPTGSVTLRGSYRGWTVADFADHDQALLLASYPSDSQVPRLGRSTNQYRPPSFQARTFTLNDNDIEIRDAGKRPTVLATTAQIAHDLACPPAASPH